MSPDEDLVYRSGETDLEIAPEKKPGGYTGPLLTWRLWHIGIVALRGFTGAYPGVDFKFRIFVREEVKKGEEQRVSLGDGILFSIS